MKSYTIHVRGSCGALDDLIHETAAGMVEARTSTVFGDDSPWTKVEVVTENQAALRLFVANLARILQVPPILVEERASTFFSINETGQVFV